MDSFYETESEISQLGSFLLVQIFGLWKRPQKNEILLHFFSSARENWKILSNFTVFSVDPNLLIITILSSIYFILIKEIIIIS